MTDRIEAFAKVAVDCGFQIHREIGPGLLESAYELLLAESLVARGLFVERQVSIDLKANGIVIDNAFRADILIEKCLLLEIKSTGAARPRSRQASDYISSIDATAPWAFNEFRCANFQRRSAPNCEQLHRT